MGVTWNCFPTGKYYPGISEAMADALAESEVSVAGLASTFDAQARWQDLPLVVVDFETTGLSAESDRVLEIGMVCIDAGVVTEVENILINPGIPVPEEASAVHGITDEMLADAPVFSACCERIARRLTGRIPVAYNASFDAPFLRAEWARAGADATNIPALSPEVTWLDPLVWVREVQKYEKGKKLTDVCARMGIELTAAHRAAGDAEATGKVLLALAPQLPAAYGEVVRNQQHYAQAQEKEFAAWRARRRP